MYRLFFVLLSTAEPKRATNYIDLGLKACIDYSLFVSTVEPKRATKCIDLGLNAYIDYFSFFHPLPSQNEALNIVT